MPTEKRPHGRSLSDFGKLWPAERLLLEATRIGEIAVVGEVRPDARTDDNVVRAGFLRFLLLGGDAQAPVHELGARLKGAWVEGKLDLTYSTTTAAVSCERCTFDHPIMLWYARVSGLFGLIGSSIRGIVGDFFRCDGPMYLRDGFQSEGSIRLPSALISGCLDFDGARLDGLGDCSLNANGIDIRGDLFLGKGFEAIGLVSLILAKIAGVLECAESRFDGKEKNSLLAISATINGGVYLGEKMHSAGPVVFDDARIDGDLHISNCAFDGHGKAAFSATTAIIRGCFIVDDGAKILGSVDLREAQVEGQLRLGSAVLDGKSSAAMSAGGATINAGVFLSEGLKATGIIDCKNIKIIGGFYCSGARLDGNGKAALELEFAKIIGAFFIGEGFEACGFVQLNYARIEGAIVCREVVIQGSDGYSIAACGLSISGDFSIASKFRSHGCISLLDARIGGTMSCCGAVFDGDGNSSVVLNRANIGGSLIFDADCRANGSLVMNNIRVGANIECALHVDGQGSAAVAAYRSVVGGSFCFVEGFKALGGIDLVGSKITGDLSCKGASFEGQENQAINARSIEIEGSVYFFEEFSSSGTVSFVAAKIRGDMSCYNAAFDGSGKESLVISGAKIDGYLYLCERFKAAGEVRLVGAEIGGDVNLSGACFDVERISSLIARHLRVGGRLFLRDIKEPALRVILSEASVGVLVDDVEAWGRVIEINNFVYGSIAGGSPTSARYRIAWLDKQEAAESGLAGSSPEFRPQPWRHLQKVLREMGHAEDARQVAIALEHRMRKAGVIGQSQDTQRPWLMWANRPRRWLYRKLACFFHWWFWALTGYGYRPMRLMVWMLAVWLGSAAFYWAMALPPRDVFAPTNPLVFQSSFYRPCLPCEQIRESTPTAQSAAVASCHAAQAQMRLALQGENKRFYAGNWYLCPRVREEYTGFSPLAYSLDVILPLVDLQQQKDWGPMIPTPEQGVLSEFGEVTWKHITRFVIWFETLFGWLASLLLVAIVSGLTKRRED